MFESFSVKVSRCFFIYLLISKKVGVFFYEVYQFYYLVGLV